MSAVRDGERAPLSTRAARLDLRAAASAVLLGVSITLTALALFHVGGPVRLACGLVFVLFVPGWSLVSQLRLRWPAAELSLTMAVSLAVVMIAAQLMLWLHVWHPVAAEAVLAVLCAPLLARRLFRLSLLKRMEG